MKSVLISIQPKWCELIASGKKTIEVRKTAPKLKTPFKCYIYCTKAKSVDEVFCMGLYDDGNACYFGNQKIIGEFICDKVMRFTKWGGWLSGIENYDISFDHLKETCLDGLWQYGNGKPLYGWHISDLKIYDKPKELSEFKSVKVIRGYHKEGETGIKKLLHSKRVQVNYLTRPPQNWCYVEEL